MTDLLTLAIATDDGVTISPHFGRAAFFEVITVKGATVLKRERREKPGCHSDGHHDHPHTPTNTSDPAHLEEQGQKHNQLVQVIPDCQVVISRGMGNRAYESLAAKGVKAFVTDAKKIDEAIQLLASGQLIHHENRLH